MTLSRFALPVALFLSIAPLFAQAPPPNAPMHGQRGARARAMADSMHFTDAQKAQLRTILVSAGQQVQALQANTSLTQSVRTAKMQAIQQRVRTQMMAILTPAQRAHAQAMAQQSYGQRRPM